MTPIVVFKLGIKEYGIYIFINTTITFVNIIDLGLGQAIIKHVAFYHGAEESDKLRTLIRTANSLFLLIGTIGFIIFFGIALYGKNVMPNTFSAYSQYSSLFFITGVIFFIDSLFRAYSATINGLQRYDLMAKIGMLTFTITTFGTLLIVSYGGKLYPIFLLQLVMTFVADVSIFIAVRKTAPDTTRYALAWDTKEIKRSYAFALTSSINGIAGLSLLYLDKLIMPFYVGPSNLNVLQHAWRHRFEDPWVFRIDNHDALSHGINLRTEKKLIWRYFMFDLSDW